MTKQTLINQINASKTYLDRSTEVLGEMDSAFAPAEGMMTVAQQIAHIALTVDWFREGTFGSGFNMDFETLDKKVDAVTSLAAAQAWCSESFTTLVKMIEDSPDEYLAATLPPGPVMGDTPRIITLGGVVEHTAHHRGALTVYSRLLNRVPAMPYM